MSNLTTLPKGDSAWLLRKAIQQVIEQVNTIEANVNPAATGGSLNTQVLFNDAGAVKGDTNLTFNKTTDTLTSINGQFTNLNASGNVAVGNLTVSGTFTALGGENASAIRAAASDYAAVTFDGATTATRVSAPCQAIGTGDFSMWVRFRVPVAQPSVGGQGVITTSSGSTGAGSRAFGIRLSLSTLNVTLRDAAGVTAKNAGLSNFHTNFAGQVVDVVVTRSGSTFKLYINGTDTAYSDTGSGAWSDTVTSSFLNVGVFDSTDLFLGRIFRSVVFNRALSASDVTELITVGVNPADQWGTQTGQTSGTLVASKRYRITTYVSADSFTNVGAASNTTGVEFVATGTTPTTWTNASTLNRIGGLVDLDFTVGTGYQATDRSTNALHGTLFNGVEFTQPKRMAVLYATTNTNGNQQMLATLAIPTNAVIEDIIVNSTGSATVSVGNASAGTQIVNGASVVSGRQKLTIATPFSTTGNLWVNSSSTATLQFTILYTIAS